MTALCTFRCLSTDVRNDRPSMAPMSTGDRNIQRGIANGVAEEV